MRGLRPGPRAAPSTPRTLTGTYSYLLTYLLACLLMMQGLAASFNGGESSPFALEDWAMAGDTSNIAEEARKLFSTLATVEEAGGGAILVPLNDGSSLRLAGVRIGR